MLALSLNTIWMDLELRGPSRMRMVLGSILGGVIPVKEKLVFSWLPHQTRSAIALEVGMVGQVAVYHG